MIDAPPQNLRTVALVGHCGPDTALLRSAVSRILPEVQIEIILDSDSLQLHLNQGSVLLVNRVLDGAFPSSDGIELIRRVSETDDPPVPILVSNYPDAQEQAIAAGARPGFGKSELYERATADKLREAIIVS